MMTRYLSVLGTMATRLLGTATESLFPYPSTMLVGVEAMAPRATTFVTLPQATARLTAPGTRRPRRHLPGSTKGPLPTYLLVALILVNRALVKSGAIASRRLRRPGTTKTCKVTTVEVATVRMNTCLQIRSVLDAAVFLLRTSIVRSRMTGDRIPLLLSAQLHLVRMVKRIRRRPAISRETKAFTRLTMISTLITVLGGKSPSTRTMPASLRNTSPMLNDLQLLETILTSRTNTTPEATTTIRPGSILLTTSRLHSRIILGVRSIPAKAALPKARRLANCICQILSSKSRTLLPVPQSLHLDCSVFFTTPLDFIVI